MVVVVVVNRNLPTIRIAVRRGMGTMSYIYLHIKWLWPVWLSMLIAAKREANTSRKNINISILEEVGICNRHIESY